MRQKESQPTALHAVLSRPSVEVAPELLGAVLRHRTDEGTVAVRLTEVEAYAGADDPGSHGYRGMTARTEVMFGPAGHLYVYFTYGMHYCCNVVVDTAGTAAAVLIRAGAVVEGLELARSRRLRSSDRNLARGPARLCQALAIDRQHNGTDLGVGNLTLTLGRRAAPDLVATGPRVGVRDAPDNPWRFWLKDEPTVSTYRPAAPLRRRRAAG
jgi:DNA-3-methyladenine glycosylase